ncbi:hypothetical protein SDC9_125496 [bioreactor metagenome]|uniref:Tripartite tricarboxylate transporter family receptor n=1 Tax=bioreactor metagenome TaxID=1076179 RepID=A0A645CNL8_9ZZZZ
MNWIGLLAPAKTSPAIVTRLHETLQKIVERPEVKSALEQAAIETRLSKSPQDFQQFINKEDEKWSKVVKESGAKAD